MFQGGKNANITVPVGGKLQVCQNTDNPGGAVGGSGPPQSAVADSVLPFTGAGGNKRAPGRLTPKSAWFERCLEPLVVLG